MPTRPPLVSGQPEDIDRISLTLDPDDPDDTSDEISTIGRRHFLQMSAATLAAIGLLSACKCPNKSTDKVDRKETIKKDSFERGGNGSPKLKFEKTSSLPDVELPPGLPEDITADSIAEQLERGLKNFFKRTNEIGAYHHVVNECFRIFERIDVAFAHYFQNNRTRLTSNIQVFIDYVNSFLERKNVYLFADFKNNKYVNLYEIEEKYNVSHERENIARVFVQGKGAFDDTEKFGNTGGMVINDKPDLIHYRPKGTQGAVREISEKGPDSLNPNFAEEIRQASFYHEGVHCYLFQKYPHTKNIYRQIGLDLKLKMGEYYIDLSGIHRIAQIHELAAFGAQLADAKDSNQIFMLIGNYKPQYKLLRHVLVWALINGMSADNPLKAQIMDSFEKNQGRFNDQVLREYFEKNENLALVQKAGRQLYGVGEKIIKGIPAN
jgi:hypothetical protein